MQPIRLRQIDEDDFMHTAAPPVDTRASQAWARAGLPARYEKLSRKGEPKYALQIGAGAFGRVYKAYDRQTSRYVAVKKMVGIDAAKLARNEFRIGACLQHPQLVETLAVGVSPYRHREKAYLVLGFIQGEELTTWGQAPRQAIVDVLDAIHYLHTRRIVHQDIHPQNILVGDARAWLVDLGRARSLSRFSTKAVRADMRQVCNIIEEGLLNRQQIWSVVGGKPDPTLMMDFESLKRSSVFSSWVLGGSVPQRSLLFAHPFFVHLSADDEGPRAPA